MYVRFVSFELTAINVIIENGLCFSDTKRLTADGDPLVLTD
jgi:hypothetical protein